MVYIYLQDLQAHWGTPKARKRFPSTDSESDDFEPEPSTQILTKAQKKLYPNGQIPCTSRSLTVILLYNHPSSFLSKVSKQINCFKVPFFIFSIN